MGALPPVFLEFLGKTIGIKTAMADVKAEVKSTEAEGVTGFQKFGKLGSAAVAGIGIAAAGAAVGAVKMAADFQTQMNRVRTGAGETAGNMKMVSDGVLAMAGQVGQSTSHLTSGLYLVESAGYHGADALNVLKIAAQGAKVGAADLGTTGDALTTVLKDYGMSAGQATTAMNALVATEGQGKTTLEALAGSMSTILPTASAAHIGLQEILGAMATMTAEGTPAADAATYLRQSIIQLEKPSGPAAAEMKKLGINAIDVSKNLGKNGLASTLTMLTDAIHKNLPANQTFTGALATMVGGAKSSQAALLLTGQHMKDFAHNTDVVAQHMKAGGKSVEGWDVVQKSFNQKMAEAKAGAQALAIQVGNALLPIVTKLMDVVAQVTSWLTRHKNVATALAIVIGVALVAAFAAAAVAVYGFVTSAAALEAIPWVAAITAIIIVILLLATHWRQVWSVIKAVGLAVGHALVAAWNWLKSSAISIWRGITSAVMAVWHGLASFFVGAWHAVVDPIIAGWHWLERTTSAIWNAIAGFFKKWWPLLLVVFAAPIAILLAIWNHWHKQIESVAKSVWNGIKDFFSSIWDGVKAVAISLWSAIKMAVIQPMEEVWHWLKSLWHTVSGWLASAWHGIESAASNLWNAIKAAMVNPFMAAYHALSGIVGQVGSAIWNGLVGAWHAVEHVGDWFLQIGSSIVDGIINGVENAGSALFSSLKNLAGDALDAAKSFLGINSPSRLFRDEIGQWIPHGVAEGIKAHSSVALNAVRRLTGGISANASVSVPGFSIGSLVAPGFGPSSAVGGPTVINVTVQGSVLTERDLRDVIQEQFLQLGGRNSMTWAPYRK